MSTASPAVRHNPVLVVVALCLGGLGASLSQTLVIPIQSDLPRLLGTSASNTSWVVTITLLGGAVAMPIAGRVADMIGKRRVLILSAALLVAGSLAAALAGPARADMAAATVSASAAVRMVASISSRTDSVSGR